MIDRENRSTVTTMMGFGEFEAARLEGATHSAFPSCDWYVQTLSPRQTKLLFGGILHKLARPTYSGMSR
jgi:hypothetical protein